MRAAVIIPTYNEKENLPLLVQGIRRVEIPVDIIVVDDNSPDGTGVLAEELARDDGALDVIHRSKKAGLGTAHLAGFVEALKVADIIITMDADLSHDPASIPRFIAMAKEGYDVVIGSRYVKGGRVDFGLGRRVLSRGGNLLATIGLGFTTKDNTSGYRCYRREALEAILSEPIQSDGYSFLMEILFIARKKGLRVAEIPITYIDRRYGETKVSRAEISKALGTVWRLRFRSNGR